MATEPRRPRRQVVDCHTAALPDEILAIVRVTWYSNGRPDEIEEVAIMEDNQDGYDTFAMIVRSALDRGASVSISTSYRPEDLGICING